MNRNSLFRRTSWRRLFQFTVHSSLFTVVAACRATTSRPSFVPLPSAASAEIELEIPDATRALAETLARDSIALSVIRENDGFIDSGWLDAVTLEHTSKRPPGSGVVRVRAWVNPAKQFWSELVVEATFRPFVDPSRPDRELDAPLPPEHPLQRRIGGSLRKLIEAYGDTLTLRALQPARPDTSKARRDTTAAKRDTVKVRRDTTYRS